MARAAQVLIVFAAVILLMGSFFFGYLVGQGEFMQEQERIEKFIGDTTAKIGSILGFKSKGDTPLIEDISKELRLQFYEEKALAGKNEGENLGATQPPKRFFLEIKVTNPNVLKRLQEELKNSGIDIKVEGGEKNTPKTIRLGPMYKETDAKKIKERLSNRLKDQEIKIITER